MCKTIVFRRTWLWLLILGLLSGCQLSPELSSAFSAMGYKSLKPLKIERFFDDPQVRQLAEAAAGGDVAAVKRLVAGGVDPNSVGNEGMTPLWWAFGATNIEGVKALMDAGADPDFSPRGQAGRMLRMALKGHKPFTLDMAKVLLEGGADPNRRIKRGKTPLNQALYGRPRLEKIQALVRHGADIHAVDDCGNSLLQSALAVTAHDVAKWLIEQGVDVHHVDKNGGSAAWEIDDRLTRGLYADWARKSALEIKAMLEARGVKFPPPLPYGWRKEPPPGWKPC